MSGYERGGFVWGHPQGATTSCQGPAGPFPSITVPVTPSVSPDKAGATDPGLGPCSNPTPWLTQMTALASPPLLSPTPVPVSGGGYEPVTEAWDVCTGPTSQPLAPQTGHQGLCSLRLQVRKLQVQCQENPGVGLQGLWTPGGADKPHPWETASKSPSPTADISTHCETEAP